MAGTGAIRPIPNKQNGAEKAVGAMQNEWRPLAPRVTGARISRLVLNKHLQKLWAS
jgi:hypothetical protein